MQKPNPDHVLKLLQRMKVDPGRAILVGDCLLYTSDAADDLPCVDLGGRRIIKKKKLHYVHQATPNLTIYNYCSYSTP